MKYIKYEVYENTSVRQFLKTKNFYKKVGLKEVGDYYCKAFMKWERDFWIS